MFGLSPSEMVVFRKLNTPIKIQDFLDSMPINWCKGKEGHTYMSPRRVLREQKMHCLEGALFAAAALWIQRERPLLLDLKADGDDDHVVALYKRNGYWGAISKTNHATVRFRDPVYKTVRELAVSYFHEYFVNKTGKKVLRSFSEPFSLKPFGTAWITAQEDLDDLVLALDDSPHTKIFPSKNIPFIRKADPMEKRAGVLIEWKKSDPRT